MIVLIEDASARLVFANVTSIEEKIKPSMFDDAGRRVLYLFNGAVPLMGGDDIDPMTTRVTVLPNAERE